MQAASKIDANAMLIYVLEPGCRGPSGRRFRGAERSPPPSLRLVGYWLSLVPRWRAEYSATTVEAFLSLPHWEA
jgi:hypothetical protein